MFWLAKPGSHAWLLFLRVELITGTKSVWSSGSVSEVWELFQEEKAADAEEAIGIQYGDNLSSENNGIFASFFPKFMLPNFSLFIAFLGYPKLCWKIVAIVFLGFDENVSSIKPFWIKWFG